jgi:tRNA threonylcarbamoyladenosine biosynthesis protein TsaB
MARILALDTTAELGSIALYDGAREVLSEVALHSPEGFGHILFDRIAMLLERGAVRIEDIDCFASASGPGSFTGVRIGLTAAKGLAEATRKCVAPVSNLKALAACAGGPLRAAVVDARRGEIYGALYGADLETIQPERVMTFPAWIEGLPEGLPEGPVEFAGTNIAPFTAALEASRFRGSHLVQVVGTLAGIIARIGHEEFTRGRAVDPAAVDANYVRRSDAELLWKDR